MPAVLNAGHSPFCWGRSASEAADTAVVLEEVASLAFQTLAIRANAAAIAPEQLDKHFIRKHGSGAYYGQPVIK